MNAEAIVAVSSAVVGLVQMVKWGKLPDSYGPWAVMGFSLLGVAFWGWSAGDVTRASAFSYFAGWIAVSLTAAGIFGFTRATATAVTNMSAPPANGAGSSPTVKS